MLNSFIKKTLQNQTENRFNFFVSLCQSQYNKPVHNMVEMRMRMNRKLRGDVFEDFCQRYLKHVYPIKMQNVWLFSEMPFSVKEELGMRNQDMGIDIVCKDFDNKYYAVQVKYRKHTPFKQRQFIGWQQLATFYALAYRTGPFYKHIVMTNVDGVRHVSKKTPQDESICKKRFQKMSYFDWKKMIELGDRDIPPLVQLSQPEIRQKRLEFFNRVK